MSLLLVHSKDLNKWLWDLWVIRKCDFLSVCLFWIHSENIDYYVYLAPPRPAMRIAGKYIQFLVIFPGILRSSQLPWFLLRQSLHIFEETQERRSSSLSDDVLRGGRDS